MESLPKPAAPAPRYDYSDRLDRYLRRPSEARTRDLFERLLRRLDVPTDSPAFSPASEAGALLALFARDVVLAAQWYLEEELRYLFIRRFMVWSAIGVSMIAMVGTLVLSMFQITSALFEYGAAFVSLLIAVCFGSMRIIGAAHNLQAHLAACAEVRAALTENIDRFEDAWRGRLTAGPPPDFVNALRTEIGKARAIVRDERKAYYAAMKSVDDVLNAAESQVTGIRAAALALVGLRAAEKKEREERRTDEVKRQSGEPTRPPGVVERELTAARRELEAERRRLELLRGEGFADDKIREALARRIECDVVVGRLESELQDARGRIRVSPHGV